jgi:hypothetical protein
LQTFNIRVESGGGDNTPLPNVQVSRRVPLPSVPPPYPGSSPANNEIPPPQLLESLQEGDGAVPFESQEPILGMGTAVDSDFV